MLHHCPTVPPMVTSRDWATSGAGVNEGVVTARTARVRTIEVGFIANLPVSSWVLLATHRHSPSRFAARNGNGASPQCPTAVSRDRRFSYRNYSQTAVWL